VTDPDDPRDPRWCGLAWSEWHPLDGTAESGLVPPEAGLYRLRCRGRAELIYVGISDRVSWAPAGGTGRRELMGMEVDLIAACRARYGQSPACQFHGSPAE
jgi:hypothetical protein